MGRRVWQATVHGVSKESEMTERLSHSFTHLYMTTGKTIAFTIWTLVAKWCLCFSIHCLGLSQLFFQGASIFYFVAAVTIHSDFGAQENSLSLFPILPLLFSMRASLVVQTVKRLPWSEETGCHDHRFLNAEFAASFFTPLLPSSRDSLVLLGFLPLKWYFLRLLIFLPAILIPACDSSLAFLMIYSTYKLNK